MTRVHGRRADDLDDNNDDHGDNMARLMKMTKTMTMMKKKMLVLAIVAMTHVQGRRAEEGGARCSLNMSCLFVYIHDSIFVYFLYTCMLTSILI